MAKFSVGLLKPRENQSFCNDIRKEMRGEEKNFVSSRLTLVYLRHSLALHSIAAASCHVPKRFLMSSLNVTIMIVFLLRLI